MGERIGDYELGDTLGRGGMGAVMRARHVHLGVTRAIKVMARPDNPRSLARFEREVQTLAEVSHPNVVRIHEAGVRRGEPWFAMDLVEGQTLDGRLESGSLPWEQALEIAVGICRGVHALHEHGVIHRDLKPANIMLDEQSHPIVIDLGLAIAPERDQRLTKTGALLGTLNYMAPEQFSGGRPSPRTDVYALGLITFELVTGTPGVPVKDTFHSQAAAILQQRVPPSSLDPELPAALDRLVMQTLAQDPAKRPPDAGALADGLEEILANPGVSGAHERYRKYTVGILALALLLVVVIAGVLGFKAGSAGEVPPSTPGSNTSSTAPEAAQRAATAQLREHLRLRNLRKKASQLDVWLRENPAHPERAEAMEARDRALMSGPLLELTHPGLFSAALTPSHVITAGKDKLIRLWDRKTGAETRTILLPWAGYYVDVTPDGRRMAVSGAGTTVRVYDLTTGEVLAERLASSSGYQTGNVCIDASGTRVAVASYEGDGAQLLAMPDLSLVAELGPHRANVVAMEFSPDGARLLLGSTKGPRGGKGHAAVLWELPTAERPGPAKLLLGVTEPTRCHAVALDGTGARVAIGTSIGYAILASEQGEPLYLQGEDLEIPALMSDTLNTLPLAHVGSTKGLVFSPDGRRLYTVAERTDDQEGELHTWDVASGKMLQDGPGQPVLPTRWALPLFGVVVSADGRALLVWSDMPHDKAQLWALPERP